MAYNEKQRRRMALLLGDSQPEEQEQQVPLAEYRVESQQFSDAELARIEKLLGVK